MHIQALNVVVSQLKHVGLRVFLAPAGGLAVSPSSLLTDELRDLIRSVKPQLIEWLTATEGAAAHVQTPPARIVDWREEAAIYRSHHFKCPVCIAAGRGSRYGQRCALGKLLWQAYSCPTE